MKKTKSNVIESFLSLYSSKNTIDAYRTQLTTYFKIINADPDSYFNNGRDYKQDINDWWKIYSKNPPYTRTLACGALKMLFEEKLDKKIYYDQFEPLFWKKLKGRVKGKKALTQDKVPTPEELKEILQHSPNVQSKALFLVLATSGMRIMEALQITLDNIHIDENPVRIEIPVTITKNGNPRTTFMSNEARDTLKAFLKVRTKYIDNAVKVTKNSVKRKNDNRIFPFTYQNAWVMWQTSIKNSEYNQRDTSTRQRRYKYHIYVLRKFFRSRLPNAIGVDITEFLMGHEGYLTKEYRNYPMEELAKEYLKGMGRLLIFETPADTSDIREALDERTKQMTIMQKTMEEMKAQILELRLEKLEKQNGIKSFSHDKKSQ